MKQYITKLLKSIAILFLTFPVSYIVLSATLFNIPMSSCIRILLSPFYYVVAFVAVCTGYGLWEMKRWSWYLFLILQVLVCYENAVLVHAYAETHYKVFAFIFSVFLQILFIFRVAREIRVPYFFPRISWWESDPRYRLRKPVKYVRRTGEGGTAEVLDISALGCFIKLHQDMIQGELISIELELFNVFFKCEGKVVWCAPSAVTHPKGIGVKFNTLSRNQKYLLKVIIKKLKKIRSQSETL